MARPVHYPTLTAGLPWSPPRRQNHTATDRGAEYSIDICPGIKLRTVPAFASTPWNTGFSAALLNPAESGDIITGNCRVRLRRDCRLSICARSCDQV